MTHYPKINIDELCEHLQLYKLKDGTLGIPMIEKLVFNLVNHQEAGYN